MTIEKIADKLKKNEIAYDAEYLKKILNKEQEAEKKIQYLLLAFWAEQKNKRNLYKEINETVDELFEDMQEDMAVEFEKRHNEGYIEGAYIAQLLLGAFDNIPEVATYNPKWHINKGSFLDDLKYYKNRLLDNIGKEIERMLALKAPANIALNGMKIPFKRLRNSTKSMLETELVYAERQGLKSAYEDYGAKKYRYLATLDNLTCETCGELDGNVFLMSEATVGANYPPIHPYCRCTTIPVFDDFESNKRVAKDEDGNNIEVTMTYEEWKKKYGTVLKEDAVDKTVIPITENAVENIKVPKMESLSDEQVLKLEKRHKELLTYAKNNNASKEVALLLDDNMDIIGDYVIGTENEIDLLVSGRSKAKYIIHNHPNNKSFSLKDINFFTKNEYTQYLFVVKNNGSVEVMCKYASFDKQRVLTELERLEKKFAKDIEINKQKGYTKVVENFFLKTKSGIGYLR